MPPFFFNDAATTEIYPLSLHDALPIFYLVEGLEPATTYYFRVRATDSAGNEGVSAEASAATAGCSNAWLRATLLSVADACPFGGAGGDGAVDPGETLRLRLRIENVGADTAPAPTLRVQSRNPFVTVRTG